MRKLLILIGGCVAFSSTAYASNFCDGFVDAYKAAKGTYSIVPICPIAPITPIRSTAYQEGVKAGYLKAQQGYKNSYDYNSGNNYSTYNDGNGNSRTQGYNSRTGSQWSSQTNQSGIQSGYDSQNRYWTYNPQAKTYTRSDGKYCSGVGTSYEYCNKN